MGGWWDPPLEWRRMPLRARQVAYSSVSSGLVPSDSEFNSEDGGSEADDAWMSGGSVVSVAVGPGADVREDAGGWQLAKGRRRHRY